MLIVNLHPWEVTPQEAIAIQKRLKNRIKLKAFIRQIKKIAAADVSFQRHTNFVRAAVVVFTYPEGQFIEKAVVQLPSTFAYIPGLLTFREGPVLLSCFKKVLIEPDIILFDGQGIAHPRAMGLAAHMGLWLEKPSIGCAKSLLWGKMERMPGQKKGEWSSLKDNHGRIIGAALRTRSGVKPVFVSPGHLIDLATAIKTVMSVCPKYRIPEPLRAAHKLSRLFS